MSYLIAVVTRFAGGYVIMPGMTTAQLNKQIGAIVEQKILEFFGDPDARLELRKPFLAELQRRLKRKQKLTPNSVVARKYGIR
jgi:hypothetical protein